jgi:hypothetical protein
MRWVAVSAEDLGRDLRVRSAPDVRQQHPVEGLRGRFRINPETVASFIAITVACNPCSSQPMSARPSGYPSLRRSTTLEATVDHIAVGGLRIAYRRQGQGPALVLAHGWPSDSRQWRRQIDALSDEFTVVAWDAPRAGRSPDPPGTFRLFDWADVFAAFIDALQLGRPHIAGLSFGAGLALELYRRHPSIPRTLILASAYAGWGGSLPPDVAEDRLRLMLRNCDLPADRWAPA